MEWQYDPTKNVYDLHDKGSVVARIYVKEKPNQTKRYIAKTLISFIYCGSKSLSRLEKSNKEWSSTRRKFATKEELDEYVARKKQAVIERIAQCDKGNLL